ATAKKKARCKKKTAPAIPPATGSGPTTPPPPPPPPDTRTTEQKIDDAVASGAITAEQGLIYKVFAGFGDPRLPTAYVGTSDPLSEPPLDDVTAQWNQLSDAAKATLGPFLIPPMHEGSYWEQLIRGATPSATVSPRDASARAADADPDSPWCATSGDVALEDWHFLEAISGPAAGKVRIWYQDRYAATDAALAGNLLSAMEAKIWPALTNLMGREPEPDFGSTGVCAGGSDAVDIALVDVGHATTTPTLRQEDTPAHMVFPRTGIDSTTPFLAHEFMHMIQYAFTFSSGDMSSGENAWLKEGTAQWAQDYASNSHYPVGLTPAQTEWNALPYFFPYPDKSLDSTDPNHHDYGTYLFWMWAARKGNDPTIVRQVWNAVAAQKSLNATKSLFASGWAQAWRDFARAVWNKDPITNFQSYDQITNTPKVESDTTLPADQPTPVVASVAPVAAKYLTFEPDTTVNSLTYQNLGGLSDEAGIQAIITYKDGTSTVEDWTQIAKQDVPFCNIDKLTLVLSNASITPNDSRPFSLVFLPPIAGAHSAIRPRADVCLPNPQGSFSGMAHYDDGITTSVDWSWSGNVDFDPAGQINPWFPDYASEVWDDASVVSGSVTVSGSGTVYAADPVCTIDIPTQTFQYGPGDGTMIIQPGPQPLYGIDLVFPANQLPEATFNCPDQDPTTGQLPAPVMIYTPDPEQTMNRGTYVGTDSFSNQFF
ncbi:MAG TPA: hypothetical protein VKF61_06665, partial [Candidatus Polarisedimenticolia bacterium]|nr:hypothetical protein [Candidatus Polarisedimenticolia bacterium]